MTKTIAELRGASNDDIVGLPEAYYPLCLAGKLVARIQLLNVEISEMPEPSADPDKPGPPRTIASVDPRAAKVAERDELKKQMQEHLSPVLLRAKEPTVWLDWEAEHPPRPDNEDDSKADCNFDDLCAALPDHVVEVGGAPLAAGDWEWVQSKASLGDLREMAWTVLRLQFAGVGVPK